MRSPGRAAQAALDDAYDADEVATGNRGSAVNNGPDQHANGHEAEGADPDVEATFEQALEEGKTRLRRTWPSLLATGTVGGVDLAFGVLAMLVVRHVTGSELLGALAFSIGFIALVLARSELFTENFLVPFAALVAHEGTIREVLRLWCGTAVLNLVGGWIMMALIVGGVPSLRDSPATRQVADHFIEQGIGWQTFASAVLAGALMTLFTWMERARREIGGKLVAAVAVAFLLTATPLLHSIVSSLEMFGALIAGADFGYADWAGMFGWSVLGNTIGGLGLVTMLRFVQVGREAIEERRD